MADVILGVVVVSKIHHFIGNIDEISLLPHEFRRIKSLIVTSVIEKNNQNRGIFVFKVVS